MGPGKWIAMAGLGVLLGACVYHEDRHGRYLRVDVPLHTVHTVQHSVRIHAPPGSTVIYGTVPLTTPSPLGSMDTVTRQRDGACLVWYGGAGTNSLAWAPCGQSAAWPVHWQQGRLRAGGWCVAVAERGRLVTRPCAGDAAQQWQYWAGQIRHLASGGCLDGSTEPVSLQACHGGPSQQFGY